MKLYYVMSASTSSLQVCKHFRSLVYNDCKYSEFSTLLYEDSVNFCTMSQVDNGTKFDKNLQDPIISNQDIF